jgi:hypothetical protein
MPYFTNHKNGKLDAIYSGRFAFIKPDNYQNIVDTFNNVTRSGVQQNATERINSLREEFGHSIQFSKMLIGNSLNGARWLLRQFFIYLPYKAPISAYYKLRFVWFCVNYDLVESMYKEEQKTALPLEINKLAFKTKALIAQDFKSFIFMFRHLPLPAILLFISMPITVPIGIFLNRHFTVYAFASDKKVIVEHGASAYTTTLAEHKGFNKLMRTIVTIVQHGYMINRRPWIIKDWVHIKFSAEKEMYEKLPAINSENPAFPDFSIYINKISAFAISWAGCKRIKKSDRIATALRQLVNTKNVELLEIENVDGIDDWNNTLGFFYMHGN